MTEHEFWTKYAECLNGLADVLSQAVEMIAQAKMDGDPFDTDNDLGGDRHHARRTAVYFRTRVESYAARARMTAPDCPTD